MTKIMTPSEKMLVWVDKLYFSFALVAAFATSFAAALGLYQYFLNKRIGEQKDRQMMEFRQNSERETAAANATASTATAEAAKLGISLGNLSMFVNKLQNEAENSRAKLEKSQADLSAAIQRANDRMAPRILTEAQYNQLIVRLSQFHGQVYSGELGPGVSDAEGLWGAVDKALQLAGWQRAITPQYLGVANDTATLAFEAKENISVLMPYVIEGDVNSGVSPSVEAAAHTLVEVLNSIGLPATLFHNISPLEKNPAGIAIKIGSKSY